MTTGTRCRKYATGSSLPRRLDQKYGSIEAGKIADIIAVDGNPLHDMAVMHRVSVVIKDGVVYKGGPSGDRGTMQ